MRRGLLPYVVLDQLPEAGHDLYYAESALRAAFETDEDGSTIALIPAVLREYGASAPYVYREQMTEMELRRAVRRHPLIALVPARRNVDYHALIVDKVEAEMVAIRDPLPTGEGTAYRLPLRLFLLRWLDRSGECGLAVTVLE